MKSFLEYFEVKKFSSISYVLKLKAKFVYVSWKDIESIASSKFFYSFALKIPRGVICDSQATKHYLRHYCPNVYKTFVWDGHDERKLKEILN